MNIDIEEFQTIVGLLRLEYAKGHESGRDSAPAFDIRYLRDFVQTGASDRIGAIAALRALTNMGLHEAQNWCEANIPGFRKEST